MGVCRVRALISTPLPRVWEFIIGPGNMHLWGPLTEPVTGIDRPLQAGDRVTQWRRDFFRRYSQELLVEEVTPYRSLRLRDLSPGGRRMDATATISLEEAGDPGATWVEEAISYSLGTGPVIRRVDRWLVSPVLQVVIGRKTKRALRRLEALLAP
jgi:uncharacterized protein YndB with AHSA1/START domain